MSTQIQVTQKMQIKTVQEVTPAYAKRHFLVFDSQNNTGIISVGFYNAQDALIGTKSYTVSGSVYDSIKAKIIAQGDVDKTMEQKIDEEAVAFILFVDQNPALIDGKTIIEN